MKKADLRGKWGLVTGASRGVGRQISLGLAREGCHLVLHSRTVSGTDALAGELRALGVQVLQVAAELSDQDQVDRMLDKALAAAPQIDIVYNNAAVMPPYRSDWLAVSAEDFRSGFEVNVIALIRICNRVIPGMAERGWGRIVNVTSGVANQPELTAYAVSKAAVDKYVKDTAGFLKDKGVLMNLMDPGWLRTDMGGPNAPGEVESVLPGALVPAWIDDGTCGELFRAQDWAGKAI